jgi:ribosomal protein L37AE/L43A
MVAARRLSHWCGPTHCQGGGTVATVPPRRRVRDRSPGSRRTALGSATSPVVQRALCWPCSSVASARRASGLWNCSWDRQTAYSPSRSKPSPQPGVAQDVVDRTEPVVGPAHLAVHHRVTPVGVGGHGGDLEHPVVGDRADQLLGIAVRRRTRREEDAHRVGPVRRGDPHSWRRPRSRGPA